jgi:hypothetical protein
VKAIRLPSIVTNFDTGLNIWIDDAGRRTIVDPLNNRPALVPINVTELRPFVRVTDTVVAGGGTDVLNVVTSLAGFTGDLTATLDTYYIPVTQLQDGLPVLHGGSSMETYYQSPHRRYFFGGEPVIDPLTLRPLLHAAGDPVRALFDDPAHGISAGDILKNPFGENLVHEQDDPMLHIAGDPVVHLRGEVQHYLGGEVVFDERGDQVFTGATPFLHGPGQVVISDRRERVYDLVQADGTIVPIGYDERTDPFSPPTFALTGLTTGTQISLGSIRDLVSGDLFKVTVYDGSLIYNLSAAEVVIDLAGNKLTLNPAVAVNHAVTVKITILVPADHAGDDPFVYYGDEVLEAGQPTVAADGTLVLDANGNVVLHTATSVVQTKRERFGYPSSGFRLLEFVPNAGTLTVVMNGVTLTAGTDYELDSSKPYKLILHPASGTPAAGTVLVEVTYQAPKFHRRGEPVYLKVGDVWTAQTYASACAGQPDDCDDEYTLGNEARLHTGGEVAFYDADDAVLTAPLNYRVLVDGPEGFGMPGEIVYHGIETLNLTTGPGADVVTIVTTHSGATNVETGAGDDRVAIRAINGATSISTSAGTDTIYVGTGAGLWKTAQAPGVPADSEGFKFTNLSGHA